MADFSRILCVIDPTQEEQPALQRAKWFAEHSGAEIDLLVCCYNEYLSGHRLFDSESLQKARGKVMDTQKRKLEALAAPLRAENLSVTTTAMWFHPLDEAIARQATLLRADIVFKDTHYHSGLSRALFTNTDWSLIRICPVPLWLVNPRDVVSTPAIITAVDPFNEHDKPATLDDELLGIGQSIADCTNSDLHAFHCFDSGVIAAAEAANSYNPLPISMPDLEREMREHHQHKFSEIAERHGIAKDRSHLAFGSVQVELPALATELDAALVVMGAVSRSRLDRFVIGATAEKTLSRLPCDLLVVKPKMIATPVNAALNEAA